MTEYEEMIANFNNQMEEDAKNKLEQNSTLIDDFIAMCKNKNIDVSKENFRYIYTIGIVCEYPNIVCLLDNTLIQDKDGLFSIKQLDKQYKRDYSGHYNADNKYLILAHKYFRRSYSKNANFAPMLIDHLWKLKDENIISSVKIDIDRVRVDVNNIWYMECDTWYGAPFEKNIKEIKTNVAVLAPPLDIKDENGLIFNNVEKFDIRWKDSNNIKTFEAEEIKDDSIVLTIDSETFFPVRYFHSEYDINTNSFRHMDGALHLYTKNEYEQRKNTDLNFNNKQEQHIKSKSIKLFKLNGKISAETWSDYISHFFTDNPLVEEYFTGKLPNNIIEIIPILRKIANK